MKSSSRFVWIWIASLASLLPLQPVAAQQGSGAGPIVPIAPLQSNQMAVPVTRADVESGATPVQYDTHTLASIEALGVGSLGLLTNFLEPSVRFTQSGSNVSTPTWNSTSSLGMNLAFADHGTRSHLTGFYRATRVLFYPDSTYNTTYQNFGVAEEFHLNRWTFRLRDDLLSSPEATVGGIDLGGLLLTTGPGLLSPLQPGAAAFDTLLTQRAQRLRNMVSAEANYYFSRRSILTVAGSFTSLTFSNASFINSHRTTGRLGYDYILSPKNMVGLIYDYTQTSFNIVSPHLRTDSVQLAYGRRLTGRMALQIMGGPLDLTLGSGNRQLTWTVANHLIYDTRRTQYSFMYARTTSGGSGVFTGATNNNVTGTIQYELTHDWKVSTTVGYFSNQAIAPLTAANGQSGIWYGTAGLDRVVGRHAHFTFNYGFQKQGSTAGVCPAAVCAPADLHQTLGATLEWHPFTIGQR